MACCDAEQVIFRQMRKARNLELSALRACEQARNQRSRVLVRQRCKLQQARVQPLELAFRHRVEVDTTNALLRTRALQPPEKNLRSTRIGHRALAQTTLDLGVGRGLALTARCAPPPTTARAGVPSSRGCHPRPPSSCSRAKTTGSRPTPLTASRRGGCAVRCWLTGCYVSCRAAPISTRPDS
jgi:hypothetical protein